MNEKRFSVDKVGIYDTQEKKHFKFIAYDWIDCDIYECCEKLNEQQATISALKEENEQLRQSYKYADELLEEIREVFEKNGVETGYNKRILETCFSALYENEQLRQELKEIKENPINYF